MRLTLPLLLALGWGSPPPGSDAAPEASPGSAAPSSATAPAGADEVREDTQPPQDAPETRPDETQPAGDPPAEEGATAGSSSPPATSPAEVPEALQVLDRTLPCGLRVLVTRDVSLPVAAVVLAVERGSEDDPPELPGLQHALAYHLMQGNRDLPPGGITSLVQDGGGIALLATGAGQTRFESLVPVSLLDDVIRAEALRLRAPTVTEALWKDTLASARRDVARRSVAPRAAVAAAHGVPALAANGRQVSRPLAELGVDAVEDALAKHARYEHATLVVVGPHEPQRTFDVIESAFADLPKRARRVPLRRVARSAEAVTAKRGNGKTFVWGIEGSPAARLEAATLCEAINRQRRRGEESKATRLRCTYEDEVRRPNLTLRSRGPEEPEALIARRLARLTEARGARLLAAQRTRVLRQVDEDHARPLRLARALAGATPAAAETAPGTDVRSRDELTGRAALASADAADAARSPADVLRLTAAVRVTQDPATAGPSRTTPPDPDKAPAP